MDYVEVFEQPNKFHLTVGEVLPGSYDRRILSDKFKIREKEILTGSLELLPPDLLKSISKVHRLRNSDSVAMVTPNRTYGEQLLEVDVEFFKQGEKARDLIVFHEVGGHMVLSSLKSFSEEMYGIVEGRWKQFFEQNDGVLQKDKNSMSESHQDKPGIGSLTIAQEEFIADRMAEYFARKSGKYSEVEATMMRNAHSQFSEQEEQAVRRLAEATYFIHGSLLLSVKAA